MGAQKGHFWGSGGREVLDRGSGTLDLGSGRPFSTILDHDFGTTLLGRPSTPNRALAMGFGRLSTPSKGSFLGRFWALLTIFEEAP